MARILLAEDEASVREFIMRALTGVGHQVDAAGDGSDALARLGEMKAGGGSYDLLLTDILMPVMDGISLALSASRDAPDMLIMLMTGYSDQRERAYGLDAIIQDILLKPFTLDELVTRIDTVLASRKRV
ncbi:MAG: response regulator [Pseudomonadota bacterium]